MKRILRFSGIIMSLLFASNFLTAQAGTDCSNTIVISSLPYMTSDDTSLYGDDYENGSSPCSSFYMSGDDVFYTYTPVANVTVDIKLSNISATYSGIHVLDGCVDASPACVAFAGNSGTTDREILGLDLVGGTTYYIAISTWATPQSITYDLSITEPTCVNPTATYTVVDDCPTSGGFLIDVDVTDLGSATSVMVEDDQGNSVTGFTGGLTTFPPTGAYVNATDVTVTVTNEQDGTCVIMSGVLTQVGCPPPNDDCSGVIDLGAETSPLSGNTCAATNSFQLSCLTNVGAQDLVYSIEVPDGSTLTISQASNGYDSKHRLAYGGNCPGDTEIACTDDPDDQEESWANTTGSSQTVYWIQSAFSTGCGDFELQWELTSCILPVFTVANGNNACPQPAFFVDVEVTDLGSATTVDINFTVDGVAGTPVTGVGLGIEEIGPFPAGSVIEVTVGDNAGCDAAPLSVTTPASCPPANDECATATVIACDDNLMGETTLGSTDNGDDTGCGMGAGVWYEFAGIDGTVTVTVSPLAGFDPELSVSSSSDCVTFTNIDCEDTTSDEVITFTSVSGTTYYFYVGHYFSGTTFGDFDISVTCDLCVAPSFTLAQGGNDCPAGTSYDIDVDVTDIGSSITTVDISYTVDGGAATVIGSVGTGITTIAGLAPGAVVEVTVYDTDNNACTSLPETISTPTGCPPANDDAAGATDLTMGETCVDVSGDAANATSSLPAIVCAGYTGNANDDVWFKFIATTPFPTIQVTSTTDLVLELLETDQTTNVDCSDGFGGGETLVIATPGVITPGMEYYVRVYSYGTGPFTYDVCVFDELPAPAAGSAACTATGMAMSTGSGLWLNLFDGTDLVASFKDDEAMGEVNCSYHVDPTGVREDGSATPIAFLDVDYQITVATPPAGDIPIRVYFSDAEFTELAAASSTVGTTGDLNVTHVPGGDCTTGDFDNQGTTQVLIGQSGNGTVTGGRYVEFDTPSFSAFFLHGGNAPLQPIVLPLDLVSLNVTAKKAGNMVSWTTANEINVSHIEVQKSDRANGEWSTIGKLKPTGERENNYEYMDESPYAVTYYRLNTVDLDGSNDISKVVSAVRKGDNRLTVFPNPATSKLSIQTASSETGSAIYNLYDLTGKVVLTQKVNLDNGQNQIDIDISTLQSGVYMLQFATASEIYTERIVKN